MNAPVKLMGFRCGNCGAGFATKGDKRRHKLTCAPGAAEFQPFTDEREDDADLYTRERHVTPAIRARAAAEWAAMDWRGQLPKGWTYTPAKDARDV